MSMDVFDPVAYSLEENQFIKENIGKPPIVALQNRPAGVNVTAVRPVLVRVYELEELQKHSGIPWSGLQAVRDAIDTYLAMAEKWANDRRKGAPRFPSLYSYDQKNRPHIYGPGSDAGKVASYINRDSQRVRFEVDLVPDGTPSWVPDWKEGSERPESGLTVNSELNRIECNICGHTESFKADSRASFNASRARMSKHLRSSLVEPSAHRELHTLEFNS